MWQNELKLSYRTAKQLSAAGLIGEDEVLALEPVLSKYQFLLPRYYASLIDLNNEFCPIRLQAIPSPRELELQQNHLEDPLEDLSHQPVPRLTYRFRNRVLIHLTPQCSMYCRFCFRKSLLNELRSDLFGGGLEEALHFVATHPEIEEVIFSGGDPLMASDALLASVLTRLATIPSVTRIRFHTRVPVTFPMRITEELVQALNQSGKRVVLVTHFNHARELTEMARVAITHFQKAGFTLLNQTVLMAHVNDSVQSLSELSKRLFSFGILPYYLHQLDRAQGTAYFEVRVERGLEIYKKLSEQLPGYLVPRYVRDIVGHASKRELLNPFNKLITQRKR